MRKVNGSIKMMLCVFSLLLVLSACSSKSSTNETAAPTLTAAATSAPTGNVTPGPAEELKPVELVWYYPQPAVPADLKEVEAAVNKISKAKINATVKLMPQGFGDYDQKMNTVLVSGEQADIIWTSSWLLKYPDNQAKGAFIPLDDLIDQYAPTFKTSIPAFVFDATRIGGKIYAVPNYQAVTSREGFIIQKQFADKYKLDVSTIKTFADIEPFFEKIKTGDPDFFPLGMDRRGLAHVMMKTLGFEQITDGVAIKLDNPDKVINLFETPEYKQYTALMRELYSKGYVNQEAAMSKDLADLNKNGKIAVQYHNGLNPGSAVSYKTEMGGNDVILVPLTESYSTTGSVIATLQAIGKNSKNPERAMMFINLLNTDKELYNTIVFGIEGKHYTKGSDGVVKVNAEGGYAPNTDWVFGNVFNHDFVEGQDPAVVAEVQKENENGKASPIIGFIFATDPVKAEIANVTTVIDQYGPALNTGTIDPDSKLPEFLSNVKKAGIDLIVAEAQKQLDAWRSTK